MLICYLFGSSLTLPVYENYTVSLQQFEKTAMITSAKGQAQAQGHWNEPPR